MTVSCVDCIPVRTQMTTFLLPTDPIVSIDAYLVSGIAGSGIRRARELGPNATIDLGARSGLRGRGGGGFPTGHWGRNGQSTWPSLGWAVCLEA